MLRATAMGAALFQAALRVPEPKRLGTIANNVVWRGENTKAGVVYEPSIRRPNQQTVRPSR